MRFPCSAASKRTLLRVTNARFACQKTQHSKNKLKSFMTWLAIAAPRSVSLAEERLKIDVVANSSHAAPPPTAEVKQAFLKPCASPLAAPMPEVANPLSWTSFLQMAGQA